MLKRILFIIGSLLILMFILFSLFPSAFAPYELKEMDKVLILENYANDGMTLSKGALRLRGLRRRTQGLLTAAVFALRRTFCVLIPGLE